MLPFNHGEDPYTDIPLDTIVEHAQSVGATLLRVVFDSGSHNTTGLEQVLSECERHGIDVLFQLKPYDDNALGDEHGDLFTVYRDSFEYGAFWSSRFVGRIHFWELENELCDQCIISGEDGWKIADFDTPKYQRARALVQGLADGVAFADPSAQRVVNFTGTRIGYLRRLEQDGVLFEISGWHWYSNMCDGDPTTCPRPSDGKGAVWAVDDSHKPIWFTEFNRTCGSGAQDSEDPQMTQYLQTVLPLLAQAYQPHRVSAVFVFQLFNEPQYEPSCEAYYGVFKTLKTNGDRPYLPGPPKDIVRGPGGSVTPITQHFGCTPIIADVSVLADTVCSGGVISLTVKAVGGSVGGQLAVRWRFAGSLLSDGPNGHGSVVTGSNSLALTITNATPLDAGLYDCIATNACGSVTSNPASLTVCATDFDCNGFVTGDDFDAFVDAFVAGNSTADFDGNGFVNGDDFDAFVAAFEVGC